MSVNVNRTVSDQFYRYKMPRLIAKFSRCQLQVEGKGNGIKTVIVNMVDVAKALNRPPTYPTKYFGCELGAQTQFDAKNDRYIVNGSHEANKLQDMLDGFIHKFVLCSECDNPETDLHVNPKKQTIGSACKACGNRGMLDTRHKLCTFILKNPPETDSSCVKEKKEKKNRKKDKENGSGSGEAGNHNDIDAPDAVDGEEDDDDWAEETTEEAQRRRMEEISDHAKNLTLSEDLEKTLEERVNLFYNFVKQKKESRAIDSADKEILAEAERLDVRAMGPLILSELLFDENIRDQIKKYKRHFLRFCHNDKKAQKYLLGGFECLVKLHQSQLLPRVPIILKDLYDADLLEEDVILMWAEKVSKKYVSKELAKEIHAKAAPFVKWLNEAEEESEGSEAEEEEEEDDDENVEVVYSSSARELKVETVQPEKAEEDDDLDIDAI
ncbi:eukaryotic translation initiation factor 5-like isoform X1 [Sinocyclocheilus anshuiensis]|uniref:eukaryotic translation initiation factor 5-like isoform X1 n=1 Tax=Sinocyclocheilus anshuiensis TaxID=1608454 RepID=UPI0007B85D42|nr:PREDICTED: eukaryotic translation initiation factor 5-like isoform X1 [Sinocyclocheilus anshuiensis]XP_016356027.1 PREDICTED: eukaryotic translation initiation factor 5-like isoform X1 [Sinocyclocheilus anshuiensis]XP_016356028.1 PREDICTED: eukaryotic translation initiation factor 5-like isoform X1 [Sinocyclocheilus anshuiensis]XP_016356030.1 PREDICTED: eukaryotic translation initiation factor 5-like isoform X1 [Sinocyclocheilus anshuiensis]